MGYIARLTNAVTKDNIGQRVTVRFQLPDGKFRDIVGVLESWHDDVLTLRRRDGSTARVSAADVVASKIVPAAAAATFRHTRLHVNRVAGPSVVRRGRRWESRRAGNRGRRPRSPHAH